MGSQKNNKKSLFASTSITLLIVAMLIFSGPAQAVSVMILGLQDKYMQGSEVKFQIEIDINDADRFVQITNISLDAAGPIKKSSTFLLDGTKIAGDDNITIEPIMTPGITDFGYGPGFGYDFGYGYGYGNSGYGYGPGFGYDFGYGYGYGNSGYGYGPGFGYDFGYGYGYGRGFDFGYGYGYGYGYGGYGYGGGGGKLTYIYNVTVNTTYFPVGSYEVVAHLNTGNNVKPSFDSAPATFRLIIPATVKIVPSTLNLASKGVFTAFIELPSQYNLSNISTSTVVAEGARAIDGKTSANQFIAKFNVQDLVNVPIGDSVKLTVKGELLDGNSFEGSDTIRVISQAQVPGGGGGGGPSTGGRGVSTLESLDNIIYYETKDCFLTAGEPVSCRFSVPDHWISELVITGKESETATFRIEALRGKSPNVKVPAPGTKYLNVWSGSESIQEVFIRFTVDNSWLASEGITAENLRMYNWDGIRWIELDTRILSKDASAANYEARTNALSFFAISGIKAAATLPAKPSVISPTLTATPKVTGTPEAAPSTNLYLILGLFIVILAGVVFYFARKK